MLGGFGVQKAMMDYSGMYFFTRERLAEAELAGRADTI
jgi:hypothetical protein